MPRVEIRLGLNWLSRLGALTLLLGAAFFFTYAAQQGWIGELLRVLIGVAAGLAGLALGERFWRGGQAVYAPAVAAAGAGILFLSFYAAHALYHLIPQPLAFALMVATALAAGSLAWRHAAMPMAALAFLGGYLTPLLLEVREERPWFLLGYVAVLDALALRRWRLPGVLALVLTAWIYLNQFSPLPDDKRPLLTLFAAVFYALFAFTWLAKPAQLLAGLALAGLWGQAVGWYLLPALLLAAAGLLLAARRDQPPLALATLLAAWLSYAAWYPQNNALRPALPVFLALTAGFAMFLAWPVTRARPRLPDLLLMALNAGLYFAGSYLVLPRAWIGLLALLLAAVHTATAYRLWGRDPRAAQLAAGVAWTLLVLAVPVQFAGYRVSMLWSAEAAALAWLGTRYRQPRGVHTALVLFLLLLVRLLAADSWIEAPRVLFNARALTFGIAAAALLACAAWMARGWQALAVYLAGHFAILWALGLEVSSWAARAAAPENFAGVRSAALSVLMAAYAVGLVALGVARASNIDRLAGLSLIGAVVLKLYLYDVWRLALLYRMAAFAGLGVLLLTMSYLYSRHRGTMESWWRRPQP